MKCTVRCHGAQHFTDGPEAALPGGFSALDDQSCCPHANDHAVPAAVERNGRLFHYVVRRRCPACQDPGAHPLHQMVGSNVVGGNHNHATASPCVDPVLRQCHGLRSARAGGVNLCIRSTSTYELRELRMPHGQSL